MGKNITTIMAEARPGARFALAALLALLQLLLLLVVASHNQWAWPLLAASAATAVFSALVFFGLWSALLSHVKGVWARTLSRLLLVFYGLLLVYHGLRFEPLTYLIVYKNGDNAFSWQALSYLLSNATWLGWLLLALATLGLIALLRRYRLVAAALEQPASISTIAVLVLLNIVSVAVLPAPRSEPVEFLQSVYRYFKTDIDVAPGTALYPYWQRTDGSRDAFNRDEAPHVFVVMLESFSADYIDKKEAGKAVTPFFNQLKKEGYYLNNFFSGSVETSKGQFATLCSVYPSYKSNVFTSYPDNTFRCLSHILQERGYTNVFMKAYHSLNFENTGEFVTANAFEYAHGMDKEFVTPQERKELTIGWGIRDDAFYQKTFAYLDTLHAQGESDDPFFVTTMSVTNHMMFDDIPPELQYIHPQPDSHEDNYANSMYLTDRFLKTFFAELKKRDYLHNSLVIVLGDNGFPMGQHNNNYHNTKSAYNEMFKTPLLVWWPGKVAPQVGQNTARSQVDVAPTVLDLLNIDTDHHFVGQSVFAPAAEDYFVPLIQPFDGAYLGSIRYPYKYLKHIKTGRELLFNITQDPQERHNLWRADASKLPSDAPMAQFSQDINRLKTNELLLKNNRIYPADGNDMARVLPTQQRLKQRQPLVCQVLGDARQTSVVVTVEPASREPSKTLVAPSMYTEDNTFSIAPERLKPGINRISFDVYVAGTFYGRQSSDVFVSSDQVALISDLALQGEQDWGELHTNASVRGGPLKINQTQYNFGLGAHASSEYTVALNKQYRALHIGFGLDDESTCGSGAKFSVGADGEVLYTSPRIKNGDYQQVLLDVSGRTQLRLSTHKLGSGACDHTNWINPVLYRQLPLALDDR
jgi:phosphoglycerol transferase MdoB-like AlkP superfamily enzyme